MRFVNYTAFGVGIKNYLVTHSIPLTPWTHKIDDEIVFFRVSNIVVNTKND
jgi:hypothetical protein